MRKWHKKKILELVETLGEACRELNHQGEQKFADLCAQIQDFVSAVFDYAESISGENSRLSELLRSFYEMLYHAAQGQATVRQLMKLLRMIEHEAGSLKPDKIEVVFFCYKASMSDAFESVYLAARDDPACDVYFVPIPYFDRDPDGGFGQIHLEGRGFYSDIYQLTDWTEYDVSARRPDVIFIMNPYDGNNLVTSVHPDYYSERLRALTDMLVYIEYGLPLWMKREPAADPEAVKNDGVLLPVYFYCHHYIAYSKEVAAFFETLFHVNPDAAADFGLTPEKVREKFVPLGSPKFDRVLHDRRKDYVLPEEWNSIVNGKKIILYSSGLTEFLKSSAQPPESGDSCLYFRKLRAVIDAFKGRDDAVLWFRPHPLFEASLKAMRPSLFQEYHSIIREFEISGIGIFDRTQELHRAIAWSDAMISDESSLLFLYTATGKPFYIPSVTKALKKPVHDAGKDFHAPLKRRLENMRAGKGANVRGWNICIWWHNFLEEDLLKNTHFDNFTARFLDYVTHPEKYPEAAEYRRLQLQMFQDFVSNADGTAGRKIYEFVRKKALA